MKIILMRNARKRQKEWEKRLGITKEQVEEMLRNPEQIVTGYRGSFVAQSRWAGRAVACALHRNWRGA